MKKVPLLASAILAISVGWLASLATAQNNPGPVAIPLAQGDREASVVKVTADGQPMPVGEWSPSGKEPSIRYCHFDAARPVVVTVKQGRLGDKELAFATNDRSGVRPELIDPKGPTWRFTMAPNTKVYLKSTRTVISSSAPDTSEPRKNDPTAINLADRGVASSETASATKAIQAAIDEAGKDARRKTVYVPAGIYVTGTLFMRDGVTLYLAPGAMLRASLDPAEWQYRKGKEYDGFSALIFFGNNVETNGKVVGVKGASIRGRGVIDGNGRHFRAEEVNGKRGNNPYFYEADKTNKSRLIMAMHAEDCRVEGVTLRNPVFWTVHVMASRKFDFFDVKVYANFRLNNDGINYDGCTDSTIDNCVLFTGDDSHCLKNEYMDGMGGPNERIRMANCITGGFPMGIKFGWAFHQSRNCVYENNWLVGGTFGIHMGRKPIRVAGPKIAEVVNLTLRDMVIEGDLSVAVVGKAIDGYKLEGVRIENVRVNGKVAIRNTTGLTIRNLTVAGRLARGLADLPLIADCKDVSVSAD